MQIKNKLLQFIIRIIFTAIILILGYVTVARYLAGEIDIAGVSGLLWLFVYYKSHYVETYVFE